jgi:hypothetical protein
MGVYRIVVEKEAVYKNRPHKWTTTYLVVTRSEDIDSEISVIAEDIGPQLVIFERYLVQQGCCHYWHNRPAVSRYPLPFHDLLETT